MFKDFQEELQIIYKNTVQYVFQLKQRIVSLVQSKLENYENELIRQKFIQFSREIKREIEQFNRIQDSYNVQESYDALKEQIKNKINQLKIIELQWEITMLSGKMTNVNPRMEFGQQQEPSTLFRGSVKVKKLEQRRNTFQINYQCPICQQKIRTSYAARTHLRYMHSVPKSLVCPQCDQLFNKTSNLAQHITEKHCISSNHGTVNTYECPFSGKQLTSIRELQINILQQVEYLVPLSKVQKKEDTSIPLNLLRGSLLETQVKEEKQDSVSEQNNNQKLINYFCPVCQEKQISYYAARKHLKYIHDTPNALCCPHCDYLINNSSDLAAHIVTIHQKSSECNKKNTYECVYTGKILKSKREIQVHVASEAGYMIPLSRIQLKTNDFLI